MKTNIQNKIDLIRDSNQYFLKNYDVNYRFYKKSEIKNFLILILSNILGIQLIHNFIIRLIERKTKKLPNSASIVFTHNQETINLEITKIVNFSTVHFFNKVNYAEHYFSKFLTILISITNPDTYKVLKKLSNDEFYKKHLPQIAGLLGTDIILDSFLKKLKTIIIYNDHSPISTLLFLRAKALKKRTIYIQHAPISNKFPPLRCDYNLLFSQDSFDKYKISNKQVNTYIICDIRFIGKKRGISNTNPNSILICPNKLDDINKVQELCNQLLIYNYKIIIRKHPSDKRKWGRLKNVTLSRNNSIWEDLGENLWVITNESAVPLEAIYNGNLVFKASFFSQATLDNYGFLKYGLLRNEHQCIETLIHSINNKTIEYDIYKLPYFIGKVDEGQVKVKNILNQIMDK